jgi:fumarate reductase subunit C
MAGKGFQEFIETWWKGASESRRLVIGSLGVVLTGFFLIVLAFVVAILGAGLGLWHINDR